MPPGKGWVDEEDAFTKYQRCLFNDPPEEKQKSTEVLWWIIKGTIAAEKCVGSLEHLIKNNIFLL